MFQLIVGMFQFRFYVKNGLSDPSHLMGVVNNYDFWGASKNRCHGKLHDLMELVIGQNYSMIDWRSEMPFQRAARPRIV